jgi:hypothetical protein
MRAWMFTLALLGACAGAADKDPTDEVTDPTDQIVDPTDELTDTDPATDVSPTDDTDVDPTDPTDDVTDTDPADTDASDTDETDVSDTDVTPLSCKDARGICTSSDRCPTGDELPSFADDCVFSDGPGVCCEAPEAQPAGRTCADYGGVCAPIAGCGFVDGEMAEGTCRNAWPGLTCCVPEDVCGAHTQVCCGDGVAFVPTCDRGTLECNIPDTTLIEEALCPV